MRKYLYKNGIKYDMFKTINGTICKICTNCLQYKPLSPDFFRRRDDLKSGFNSHCIECDMIKDRERIRINPIKDGKLKCLKCGQYKNFDDFSVGMAKSRNFRSTICKECEIQKKKKSVNNEINPYNYIKSLVNNAKTRSKLKNIEFNIDTDFIYELYEKQNHKCAISGIEMTYKKEKKNHSERNLFNISIDRIIPGLGYTKDNVQLVCNITNTIKLNYDDDTIIFVCKKIIENYENNSKKKQI